MEPTPRHPASTIAYLLVTVVAVYTGVEIWRGAEALLASAGLLVGLVVASAAAGWLSGGAAPRLASAFFLVAVVTLPTPGALISAWAACGAGSGPALAGFRRRSGVALASAVIAAALTQALGARMPWTAEWTSPLVPVLMLPLLLVLQGLSCLLTLLLGAGADLSAGATVREEARRLARELVNILLAWALATLIGQRAWLPAGALILAALVTYGILVHLDRAGRRLRRVDDQLAARLAELETLNTIGREILAKIDTEHVFKIIDHECRKIFDVDACSIVLIDPETYRMRRVYSRRRGERARRGDARVPAVARWVVDHRRPKSFAEDAEACSGQLVDLESRSAIAAPLCVDGRVAGVLTLESRKMNAYDDRQLSLLTTIAQQVAVAVENARHFRKATIDSLTGFFVRDPFFLRLDEIYKRLRRYGGHFALLMIDLDDFKKINDGHGHPAGDALLGELAVTIGEQLREADIACRYGGDEFCVLLPETDLAGARAIAERIRSAVSRRVVGFDGLALRSTVSIGVAAYPEHDTGGVQALLRSADDALYRAKRAGRDRVVPYAA